VRDSPDWDEPHYCIGNRQRHRARAWSLKHLITLLDELQALGVALLAEGIDATTPAGKLQMHILGAIAAFERECR
jgi:DNA invertase Pin-like site-specific DNA recombinase